MAFKLGNEKRGVKNSKNVSIYRKHLDDGSIAQANMDGTIDISPDVNMDSKLGRRVLRHEQAHIDQIEEGRAAYGDSWVMWEGKFYIRKQEDGVAVIDGPNGRWPEGDPNHPWEAEAIEAEKLKNK